MALYEYRCKSCGHQFTSTTYGLEREHLHVCRVEDGPYVESEIVRVYSFAFHRPMQPHFNVGVGQYVSNKTQLEDHLKEKSERDMARNGIPVDYKVADLRDRDIFPVTEDGLQSTYDRRPPEHPVRRAIETVT